LSAVAYFENFDLAFLRALSAPLADVSGELHGEVAAEGTLDDVAALRYRAAIDTLRLAKSTVTIANERPIRLAFQGERLSADDFRLVGKGLDLRLVAPGPGGGLGAADLALDLGVIADLVPALGEAKGTLTLDLRADGPLRDPRLSGALAVADADVALINFPQPIDHLTLAVDIEPEALHVRTLTAAVGGGTLEGGGSIALAGFSPSRYDLFLRGTDVATGYAPAYVEAKIDRLDLLLSGPPGGLDLAGDIYLDQAVYTRNVDLPYVLSFFRGAGLQGSEVFQRRRAKALTFNVGIHADGGLRVKSNLADIEASADAILTGDNTRYGLLGDVVVLDGRANFAKADYEIVSGLVQFFDETRIFPVFDVTANTTVSDVAITVNVSGNADRFNLAFTSDPPQSDQEIIALLTGFDAAKVQETVRGQGGATDGPTREEAAIRVGAQVVTGQLNSVFSKYVGMRIGVDTGPTGDTRLRVTRDLSKNLAASYYWKIFGQGFGADLEYDFLRFMALVGSWETDPTIQSQSTIGAFGAGLQFQLDFQ
jgi:autotransporter translocation and assembly factor TamB